ncbi:hypothetical protein KC865_04980 [Candidatus Kaiserbacteria bacterium]|nr:hypothetical protein [Candidatus Kaiserbacteria bacterium]USN92237.1 MAG: hypothetical protein H6782_00210 [Candidatus Nomurabacteria bacterium]
MKKIIYSVSGVGLLLLPLMTFAQTAQKVLPTDAGPFGELLTDLVKFANGVLIPFILAIGFLVFVWGMFRYFIAGGANEEAKESGKNLMIYATLGFVLIIIFWGIINLLSSSTGLQGKTAPDIPTGPNKQQT